MPLKSLLGKLPLDPELLTSVHTPDLLPEVIREEKLIVVPLPEAGELKIRQILLLIR